ncbi:MAG TPA: RodZ domain-containing protein [Sphingomicrobium sp.]|jgi:cytoskeletal protein RodZ|nr:RodZ domain-containing protein [Sphingomicrobium sp.]
MVDDEPIAGIESVGMRLRAAREAKGLAIEDVASSTRIPTRHLLSLEESDWGKLPASTYSVGFAKNYAGAVGLDRAEIAEQLRAEMGSELPAHYSSATVDSFEPVDGNRSMPKGIVVGALVALVLIALLLTWYSNRELSGGPASEPASDSVAAAPSQPSAATSAPAPAVQGPVVITANEAAWIDVRDGATLLKQGELAPGQSFEVPASAARPVLSTAKPEALRISVGTGDAPAIGAPGVHVKNVSLLGADLLRGPVAAPGAPSGAAPAATSVTTNAT